MQNNLFKVEIDTNGGVASLTMTNDVSDLNWLDGEKTYGTPYGQFSVLKVEMETPNEVKAHYTYKGLDLIVTRRLVEDSFIETYSFKNNTDEDLSFDVGDLGIVTCFNDNYDIAKVSLNKKCHMHIWTGDNTTYIRGMRMNGGTDNLALVLAKGNIAKYAVTREWNSNDRGDVSLLLPACTIRRGEKVELCFVLFKYDDVIDFGNKAVAFENFVNVKCNKYTVNLGETFNIVVRSLTEPHISYNGDEIKTEALDDYTYVAKHYFAKLGAKRIDINYGEGLHTYVDVNVLSSPISIIDRRLNFIMDYQQFNKMGVFNGAYFLYDNETNKIFAENKAMNDRNLGRERVGMICALMRRVLAGNLDPAYEKKLRDSIQRGMDFIDRNIVNYRGSVYETPIYRRRWYYDRLYNYSMYMTAYILMYEITKKKKYLDKAYLIVKRYYKKGGAKFYAINIPMNTMYTVALENGYLSMAEELKTMFLAHGDKVLENSINYPAHEVKYEQSIVAPAVDILLECYLISKDRKYLDEAEAQLKLLEAFNGHQPSFHLNEIAIRHWDGFWFGKRKMYGDTFPHYWSCITAGVFAKYGDIVGDENYQRRAEICLLNNLCLFSEEGRASCAYLYPYLVNGKRGEFYDPWANDQDWAIYFNLRYNKLITGSLSKNFNA